MGPLFYPNLISEDDGLVRRLYTQAISEFKRFYPPSFFNALKMGGQEAQQLIFGLADAFATLTRENC